MEQQEKKTCPLSTAELTDVVLDFIDLYNASAKVELYDYQRIFLRRVVLSMLGHDGANITGLWSRQSGKSEAISSGAGGLCVILPALAKNFPQDPRLQQYHEGVWVGIFAPRLAQSGIIYERVRNRAEKDEQAQLYRDPDLNITLTQARGDQVAWSNGSFVSSQTASDQTNVEGRTYHLIILDEAQLIGRAKVNKEIRPMLAATMGTCVQIGTVSEHKGGFHDTITHNIEHEKATGDRRHFEFDYETVIAQKQRKFEETGNVFHLNYGLWVKEELALLGGNTDNDEFRMNFRLIWPVTSKMLFDRDQLITIADKAREAGPDDNILKRRRVAGIDLARKRDCTIVTVNEIGDQVLSSYVPAAEKTRALIGRLRGADSNLEELKIHYEKTFIGWFEAYGRWLDQVEQCIEFLEPYGIDVLCIDATGVGDPVCEIFQETMPEARIEPVIFSYVSKDRLFKHYSTEVDAGRQFYVSGPNTRESAEYKQFLHEHRLMEKKYSGNYLCPSAPEGENDDYCASAALACWASTLEPEDRSMVEAVSNSFYAGGSRARERYGRTRADRYRR